jgi:hypothetical protein
MKVSLYKMLTIGQWHPIVIHQSLEENVPQDSQKAAIYV